MNNNNALLIIDAQYDFCNQNGALFVQGADADMKRLACWIKKYSDLIDNITLTMDSHPVNDISHPSFWAGKDGNFPNPFTPITLKDIDEGIWNPRFFRDEAVNYIRELEKQGEFGHFIWPYHCLTGSQGAAIENNIMEAVTEWCLKGNNYQVETKGTYPLSEHFGIFRANVPVTKHPETLINQRLINNLNNYSNIFLAGEAKSHCVANSLKQVIEIAPDLANKFIILEDCMSDVAGLGFMGEPVYNKAKEIGIRFAKSIDISPKR